MRKKKDRQAEEAPQPVEEMQEDLTGGDDKPLPALRRRRFWKKYRWVVWLLLMVPVVYFVVQVFIILVPRMRTDFVLQDTMTDSLTVTGQVVLESVPVYGASGHLYYTVPAGQRVAAGAEVAFIYNSERGVEAMDALYAVSQELTLLYEAQNAVAEGGDLDVILEQRQQGLYQLLAALEASNYGGLEDTKNALMLAANKLLVVTGGEVDFSARIAQLEELRARYEALAVPSGAVTAPEVGYFVPSSLDDKIPVSYEAIAGYTPAQLQQMLESEPAYYGSDVAGHIVTDYKWRFFTVVPARLAEKFVPGDKSLTLKFPEVGDGEMPVTVEKVTVDEENEIAMVELYCEYIGAEVLGLRGEKAEIVFGEVKGLRIEKNALRLMDVENPDGSVTTYRGVYVKFGNMVYFRRITILVEDDFYMLIPAEVTDGVNEVKLYDEVVVDSGGVELYDKKIL